MSIVNHLCLIMMPVLFSIGQMLFKKTANELYVHSPTRFFTSALTSPYFWGALGIYGLATLFWIFILSRVPIAKAMPYVALTFVIVPIASIAFFGERVSFVFWIGVCVIIVGVCITAIARVTA